MIFYVIVIIPNLYRHRGIVLRLVSFFIFMVGCVLNNGIRAEQAVSFLIGVLISGNYEKSKNRLTCANVIMTLLIISIAILDCKQIPVIRMMENSLVWQIYSLIALLPLLDWYLMRCI